MFTIILGCLQRQARQWLKTGGVWFSLEINKLIDF